MAGAIVDNEKELQGQSQGMKKELHKHGLTVRRRYVGLYGVLLAFGRMDAEE